MSTPQPLPPTALHRRCDPEQFDFATTAELEELAGIIGQQRALAAVQFGIGMRGEGYNLYVLGPPGTGKQTTVRQFLEQQAAGRARPDDWCYVNNFADPQRPRALRFPAGRGTRFRADLAQLVEELRTTIPAAFETEEYQDAVRRMEEALKERQEKAFGELQQEASHHGMALVRTPAGFLFAPLRHGEVVPPDKVEELPDEELQQMAHDRVALEQKLEALLKQVPQWRRETRDRLKQLNDQVILEAVGHQVAELRERYADMPEVLTYLDDLQHDVLGHASDFQKEESSPVLALAPTRGSQPEQRYAVNLLVDNADDGGAPVVFEDHPTYQNLVGRVEHMAHMGALMTDFTLIHAGALHRACGGYLVLEAHKVLTQPYAWEGLKRALRAGQICIESLGQHLSLVSTVGLEPEPIPLDVKVVLIGERLLYYLLCQYDPDFNELFKVAADFEDRVERTPESNRLYARMIGTIARKDELRQFDRAAVARVVEHSSRLADDAERLSTHMRSIADLLREADYWAGESGRDTVTGDDVEQAIAAQRHRAGRIPERIQEEMRRGTILIDTAGQVVGQVNGLSVIQLGEQEFGQPVRITATARLGEGEVVDIEREVELGGSIHSKGVLILSSFLASRYAAERPLSLSASVVFEQSYGMVEGDSASVAELCALLSVLADTPIRQSLAVTGSVNQHGVVQAIGGVNEKIEGFFDLCQARELTGDQGVVIPASNVKHLMLRDDVVAAAREGRFHIYPAETIDQALEMLTGTPVGEPGPTGEYPEDTVNARVAARLKQFADIRRAFAEHGKDDGGEHSDES